MIVKGMVKKGEYFDSVSLMIAANAINQMDGVADSAVMMGTQENKAILESSGFLLQAFRDAEDSDLLVAVKARDEAAANVVMENIDNELTRLRHKDHRGSDFMPRSLEGAVDALPGANLVLISVAGKYAADEARRALKKGLHVMIFSDNVPLEQEIMLKHLAREKGLLVMGPDCGTAIINGVPLAFANVVKRGKIGVIAASGTGLQEVTTLISNNGGGISQAIGTGGRDVKQEVGGIMFTAALQALARDPGTTAILLVSKPPHPDVLKTIGAEVARIDTPVAAVFLGAEPEQVKAYGITPAQDLEEGAIRVLELAGVQEPFAPGIDISETARMIADRLTGEQKYLRALFTGGTFCSETQVILSGMEGIYSNAPTAGSLPMPDLNESVQHTVMDLGEDEFTVGKPHPMIDFSTRNQRILKEAADPETAVILLDLVLGYGANMNPIPELVPVITEAKQLAENGGRELPVVCSVTGTDSDPQDRSRVKKALEEAGAVVCRSNAEATRLCAESLRVLGALRG